MGTGTRGASALTGASSLATFDVEGAFLSAKKSINAKKFKVISVITIYCNSNLSSQDIAS